ncbi:hypothetical protein [Corynebacterium argentoratense]|uniref:Rv1157c family protein n=1 Tax=Corynebacterium argentoratense TaxID=42817 RepID=UPI0028EF5DD2|nr:hypothetical protein [Corynebacterium argentoratense]
MRISTIGTLKAALIAATVTAAALSPATLATNAQAQPAVPTSSDTGSVDPSTYVDHLGRPTQPVLDHLRGVINNPALPQPLRDKLATAVGFIEGTGTPGVDIPEGAPRIAQFAWPTIAGNCINGQKATGTAIAVPGPADLPLPGVDDGHTAFIFTALGTDPVAQPDASTMRVDWINLSTGTRGSTPLSFGGINPDGPATINATANTGRGTIAAWLSGGIATETATCNFLPTAAVFEVN